MILGGYLVFGYLDLMRLLHAAQKGTVLTSVRQKIDAGKAEHPNNFCSQCAKDRSCSLCEQRSKFLRYNSRIVPLKGAVLMAHVTLLNFLGA